MNIPTNNILAMILCDGNKYNANGDDGYNVLVKENEISHDITGIVAVFTPANRE